MARIVRDAALVSRSARLRLAPSSKRWRMLEQGLHLGYRRRATVGTLFKNAYQNMRGWESALLATISKINRPPVWRSRSVLARSAGHIVLAINYPARKSNELPDHLLAGEAICLRLLPKEVDVQYSTR